MHYPDITKKALEQDLIITKSDFSEGDLKGYKVEYLPIIISWKIPRICYHSVANAQGTFEMPFSANRLFLLSRP